MHSLKGGDHIYIFCFLSFSLTFQQNVHCSFHFHLPLAPCTEKISQDSDQKDLLLASSFVEVLWLRCCLEWRKTGRRTWGDRLLAANSPDLLYCVISTVYSYRCCSDFVVGIWQFNVWSKWAEHLCFHMHRERFRASCSWKETASDSRFTFQNNESKALRKTKH